MEELKSFPFFLTRPNGNLYFQGFRYSPSIKRPPIYSVWTNLHRMNSAMTTHSLDLNVGTVSNIIVNGSSIYGVQDWGEWDNTISIGVDTSGNVLTTNANKLYVYDASNMYYNCRNLTDTFICNPSLITNALSSYDAMKYCTNMYGTFYYCTNFNQPVIIPNSVIDMGDTFYYCNNFNSMVVIGDNVTSLAHTFDNCWNFNHPVTIPDSVTDMSSTFRECYNLNSPVTIGNGVTDTRSAFARCYYFNQPVVIPNGVLTMSDMFITCFNLNSEITIPKSVIDLKNAFYECRSLNDSTVPIHISHEIALGNTSNYIYNCLVNGYTGITFDPSRILNDA